MTVLTNIVDIDPNDPKIVDLEKLAGKYGIFNLTIAILKLRRFYNEDGSQIPLLCDENNYREMVGIILSLAIINYACVKHSYFTIPMNYELGQNFYRNYSVTEHLEFALKYISQAEKLIETFETLP